MRGPADTVDPSQIVVVILRHNYKWVEAFFLWIEMESMRYSSVLEKLQLKRVAATLTISVAAAASAGTSDAAAAGLAQDAHDTYCIACHDTSVYTRENRLAGNYDAVRAQVDRWQGTIALNWGDEEIDRMAAWLAKRYYGISCPDEC